MFLMSSADFKNCGISQEEFPGDPQVFGSANCPGAVNDPGVLQKNPKIPKNSPNPPNYFLCDKYNKWEVVV